MGQTEGVGFRKKFDESIKFKIPLSKKELLHNNNALPHKNAFAIAEMVEKGFFFQNLKRF